VASSEIQQLRRELDERITNEQRHDAEQFNAYSMQAADPIIPVGRLANMGQRVRASTDYGSSGALGGASSYMESLVQKRDAESAARMPRSTGSWEAEQNRPGSWQSGVGAMRTIGSGNPYSVGQGRPLFSYAEDTRRN
jgi:hypothetical protein